MAHRPWPGLIEAYREHLPVSDKTPVITLLEGGTPLLHAERLSADLGMSYRVNRLPFALVIDQGGIVRSKGLVNNREQLESLFNAKEMGVQSIQRYLDVAPAGHG